RAIIIDDESLAREIIKKYLSANDKIELISECSNGFEGLKAINEKKPDIVFLDIQMPKITGFEMLELIEEMPVVIFTTAYDQFALKAFEVNATDYLLKPFSLERFNEALDKALFLLKDKKSSIENVEKLIGQIDKKEEFLERIVVKTGSKISIIPIENLRWLEAQDDYVMMHTSEGKFLKQKTMKYFEDHLNPEDFIRIHRSYIVKLSQIKQIELFEKESYHVILNDGTSLPVSKNGYAKLKEIFN
ncbi:MAG: LytR/AlgR family response regulator transcription factor, partial [Clostridiales bacterium]